MKYEVRSQKDEVGKKERKDSIPRPSPLVLRTSSGGATLLEVIVYGAIFPLFLLLATQVFLTVRTTTANSFAAVNLQENYARIFSDLNQTIRAAQGVLSPSPGNSAGSLSLNSGEIVYQTTGGVLEKVVSGAPLDLTDAGVSISSLTFENIGEATQAATVRVQMTIESNYILEGGRTLSEEFQTAIGLR